MVARSLAILLLVMVCCIISCKKLVEKRLPIYFVTKSGASQEDGRKLGLALDIKPEIVKREDFVNRNGLVTFVDSKRFQYVPTKQLGAGKPDEDGNKTILETFDFKALEKIQVIDEQEARVRFEEALTRANLNMGEKNVLFKHSTLKAYDLEGKLVTDVLLDTWVSFVQSIEGIPLIGPGAKISATFDGEGNVTQLRYANRELKQGKLVPIISHVEAQKRFTEIYRRSITNKQLKDLRLNTKLVYYSPPLNIKTVKVIIPFYECSGTAVIGKKEVVLLSELIPAIDIKEYVPFIDINANAKGANVTASVDIKGGTPPYKINWSSSSTHLDTSTSSINYKVRSRIPTKSEIVMVTVTDANGIFFKASKKLNVVSQVITIQPLVGIFREYGTENAVTNQFGDLEQGFIDAMVADDVIERFSWSGICAWEQDFKANTDNSWIDNTDITLYVGHGNGDGFTFEDNNHDDDKLDYNDATGDWGDVDLEWLALYSCQVLEDDWGGMNRFDRWKQEFDGLHLLLGFHTNAQANDNFTGAFAQNMLSASPMKVREAWFKAIEDYQPSDRVGVVMGVFQIWDFAWNYNDYFWGKGSVGPDIRNNNIGGYWSLKVY